MGHVKHEESMKNRILTLVATVLLLGTSNAAPTPDLVKVQMLADASTIAPGTPFTVAVKLKLAPHWHVYWINAGDTGIPTKITFDLPPGFTAGEVQFPVPTRIVVSDSIVSYGYEDEVAFLTTITPPKDLKSGEDVTIGAKASWLVCQENCLKGDEKVSLTLKTDAKPQAANAEQFEKWRAALPLAPEQGPRVVQDAKVDAPGGQFKSVSGTLAADFSKTPEKVEWYPAVNDAMIVPTNEVKTSDGKSVVSFKVEALQGEKVSDTSLFSVLAYTVDGKRVGVALPISLIAPTSTKGP
jgi:DsbC/DsbD-like thiol-disulfide interchange protein